MDRTPPPQDSPRIDDVRACFIVLEYDGRQTLVVLLGRDGSINRMGNGKVDPEVDLTWYIGMVDQPLFDQLMEALPPDILTLSGRYDEPSERRGVECKCTISFQYADGGNSGLEILWGSESEGLPLELRDFISRAVELTDPWWQAQPREPHHLMGEGKPKERRRWRFGKP
jgi:hypothetical protein